MCTALVGRQVRTAMNRQQNESKMRDPPLAIGRCPRWPDKIRDKLYEIIVIY